jgi:hypothetical protein
MKRATIIIIAAMLTAAVFSGTAAAAAAATPEKLSPGILIGDESGLRVDSDGKYFIEAGNLKAGDVITKHLHIHNTEPYSFKIAMTATPLDETGPLKLLDEVNCKLALGGKTLYDGRVRGDDGVNMILNSLNLGTFKSGDQRTLDITLTANPEMKRHYGADSEAFYDWNFYAVRAVGSEEGPKTGEIVKDSLYFLLPAILLTSGIALYAKRHREASAKD